MPLIPECSTPLATVYGLSGGEALLSSNGAELLYTATASGKPALTITLTAARQHKALDPYALIGHTLTCRLTLPGIAALDYPGLRVEEVAVGETQGRPRVTLRAP